MADGACRPRQRGGTRRIGRRRALGALTSALLVLAARGAAQAGPRRIGYLDQGSAARSEPYVDALRRGLRALGWIEGQNLDIEFRFADGKTAQLPALAAALVRANVELIVTWSTPAALAAKGATATIPIVIGFTADPVGSGIVPALAHPGGNITGWTHVGLELRAKYLELLKEAVPDAVRFGVLWNPSNPVHKPSLEVIAAAARRLGVALELAGVRDPDELDPAFATLAANGAQALVVFPDGMFIAQMPLILALAQRHGLPAMYGVKEYVQAGGLMFYGADLAAMQREVGAAIVDRILRGARPGDLPIEQPTRFELAINLRTAHELRISIPQSLLARADSVID
jgi:putative ABC transport system substrate-binding protein